MSPRRDRGFTLLEVIVATAIFAAAIAALLPGLGLANRQERATERTQEALLIAQSKLAELEATPNPASGTGAAPGGYRWTVSLTPDGSPAGGLVAYRASVVVTPDRAGRPVTLDTLLLGRAS